MRQISLRACFGVVALTALVLAVSQSPSLRLGHLFIMPLLIGGGLPMLLVPGQRIALQSIALAMASAIIVARMRVAMSNVYSEIGIVDIVASVISSAVGSALVILASIRSSRNNQQ
jgi:hypothetical protein